MLQNIPKHGKTMVPVNFYDHSPGLKLDPHVPENFSQIKIVLSLFEKIPSFVCLVFKNENK